MSEESFSVTWWACSAYAAVTPAVGISNRCCPLLNLNPTYCQISSTLHISLSELEQVALNFTSPRNCRHFGRHASAGNSAVLAGTSAATPAQALRPSAQALRPPRQRRHFGRHASAGTSAVLAGTSVAIPRRRHIAGASPATAGASHRRRAPWL